jgi:hypothetical protein
MAAVTESARKIKSYNHQRTLEIAKAKEISAEDRR